MHPGPPDRAPLPTDPWALPDPGAAYHTTLEVGLRVLDLSLAASRLRAIEAHARLLIAWTAAINLTAVRTPDGVARLHVVDSLSAVRLLRAEGPARPALLDLGSGGGMPGLPLGIALDARRLALVDSVAKKVRFLDVASTAAAATLREAGDGPPEMLALSARAEMLAADPLQRAAWDVVTARAVGTLAELAELGLPLLRVGGRLVCWKRDDAAGSLAAEIEAAGLVLGAAGGGPAEVHLDPEPALAGHRLVLIRKVRPTPGRFPRSPAERRRTA